MRKMSLSRSSFPYYPARFHPPLKAIIALFWFIWAKPLQKRKKPFVLGLTFGLHFTRNWNPCQLRGRRKEGDNRWRHEFELSGRCHVTRRGRPAFADAPEAGNVGAECSEAWMPVPSDCSEAPVWCRCRCHSLQQPRAWDCSAHQRPAASPLQVGAELGSNRMVKKWNP